MRLRPAGAPAGATSALRCPSSRPFARVPTTAHALPNGTSYRAVSETRRWRGALALARFQSRRTRASISLAVALLVTAATPYAVLAGQRAGSGGKGGNKLPRLSITSPADGAQFNAPASIVLTATSSDQDGSVTRVSFYVGSTLVGSDTTSPYAVTWPNVGAGTYLLKATAWDNTGASVTTSGRTITVAANTPPTVSLAAASQLRYVAPASLAAHRLGYATATSANPVARVDFFAGTTLLGSDTTSPYSLTPGAACRLARTRSRAVAPIHAGAAGHPRPLTPCRSWPIRPRACR